MEKVLPCAHAEALRSSISFVLDKYDHLFTPSECQLLSSYLVLSECARSIAARLLQRKTLWVTPHNVLKYITRDSPDSSEEEQQLKLINALRELSQQGFVTCLNDSLAFESAFEAMEVLCKVDDLLEVFKAICGTKYKGQRSGKEDLLSALRRNISTQKTCFGQPLISTFAKRFATYLTTRDNSEIAAFRVKEDVAILLRRVQRLSQVITLSPCDV